MSLIVKSDDGGPAARDFLRPENARLIWAADTSADLFADLSADVDFA